MLMVLFLVILVLLVLARGTPKVALIAIAEVVVHDAFVLHDQLHHRFDIGAHPVHEEGRIHLF